MSPSQAAKLIGCSPQHVRTLIRSGKLKATAVPNVFGYRWDITKAEALRYRNLPTGRGFPRGHSRTKRRLA